MSHTSTRRGFIAAVAAAAGGAVALPVVLSGQASAATAEASPLVTHPDHPNAQYAAGASGDTEPLNACAPCGLEERGA